MAEQSATEQEMSQLIVDTLDLQDVDPAEIEPEAPLFREGLGLDSIDALELSLAISQQYGVQLRADDSNNKAIFATLRSLTAHVDQNRSAA
ncbi:MAG: phosphopantetheine-binding protein [Salinisphaeraceae bacterium]|nr:phosphopantetheine-binding protein [Salinisphaeraceae bacterium]